MFVLQRQSNVILVDIQNIQFKLNPKYLSPAIEGPPRSPCAPAGSPQTGTEGAARHCLLRRPPGARPQRARAKKGKICAEN